MKNPNFSTEFRITILVNVLQIKSTDIWKNQSIHTTCWQPPLLSWHSSTSWQRPCTMACPGAHSHLWPPSVFTHTCSQPPLLRWHSSISRHCAASGPCSLYPDLHLNNKDQVCVVGVQLWWGVFYKTSQGNIFEILLIPTKRLDPIRLI